MSSTFDPFDHDAEMPARKGRGARTNPANRFEPLRVEEDPSALDEEELQQVETQYLKDTTRSILAKNDSPDIPFTYSINPYRGCEHGCVYCYARPTHEYLGFSAGLDFETKIVVKEKAPELLSEALQKPSWTPQVVTLSGNTDPYQPVERKLRLSRQCLEVLLRHRNPVGIITKNGLVTRDLDVLQALAERNLVAVTISVTSLRPEVIGAMEPRTARPALRLKTIEQLADAGVPVGVNAAPLIPGLTDEELPGILEAAAERGASYASYIVVRLPGAVEELFVDWLERHFPARRDKVLRRIRSMRGGKLNETRFGHRMRAEGEWGRILHRLFEVSSRKHGLNRRPLELSTDHFRRLPGGQLGLF